MLGKWRVPNDIDMLEHSILNTPFEVIKQSVQDKYIGISEVMRAQQMCLSNTPTQDKLGFYHFEDIWIPNTYSTIYQYSFRSAPPSWLSYTGYTDMQQHKGYANIKSSKQADCQVFGITQDVWQVVDKNKIVQSKPQRFQVEYTADCRFNQLLIQVQLERIPYVIIDSVKADGMELLYKSVQLSDECRVICSDTKQQRIVISGYVPDNVWQHRVDSYTISISPILQTLNTYAPEFTLTQKIPVERKRYDISVSTYELEGTQITTNLYDGTELRQVMHGSFSNTLTQTQDYITVQITQTGSEYVTPVLKQVFIGEMLS